MGRNVSIAVIVLTQNDSVHLAQALRHATCFAEEIFLIDSFSTDNTVDIAKSFGATVFGHSFENHAKQFQWALDHAPVTTDWVMRLQPDEIIEADLADEIIERLRSLPLNVTAVYFNRKTIFQGKFIRWGGEYPSWVLRIWRNGKTQIEDMWTEEFVYQTEGESVKFCGGFAVRVPPDLESYTQKLNRLATWEALEMVRDQLCLPTPSARRQSRMDSIVSRVKRLMKKFHNRIPFALSAAASFVYRYIIRLGFLDGRAGLTYHIIRFWYRFLVGAKLRELEGAIGIGLSLEEAWKSAERRAVQVRKAEPDS